MQTTEDYTTENLAELFTTNPDKAGRMFNLWVATVLEETTVTTLSIHVGILQRKIVTLQERLLDTLPAGKLAGKLIEELTNLYDLIAKAATHIHNDGETWSVPAEGIAEDHRTSFKYWQIRRTVEKKAELLNETVQTVTRCLDAAIKEPERENHYKVLEQLDCVRRKRHSPTLPGLVVYRICDVEKLLERENKLQREAAIDLSIQTVTPETAKQGACFAVIPEGRISTFKVERHLMEQVSFQTLLEKKETIDTALKLYATSTLSFQKCLDAAERI